MSGRIAWSLFGLSLLAAAAALALWIPTRSLDVSEITTNRAGDPTAMIAFLFYAAIGSLIVSRRFGNRVGWLFLAVGVFFELGLLAQQYAIYALRFEPGSLPGGSWAGVYADLLPVVALGLGGALLLLTYPTGHLLSRRWRPVVWLLVSSFLVVVLATAFGSGTLRSVVDAPKPVELDFPPFKDGELAWFGVLLAGVLAITSVVVRFRAGDAVERQQLRWFLAAVPVFVVSIYWVPSSDALAALLSLGIASLPVAAGIAILRYRLYDLDVVIRRTLVYGVLTAGLTGLYFAIVLVLQEIFSGVAGGSDLAIAGSTLAVAALFRPVRSRLQALVDRRFFRRRYDAGRALEGFTGQLREQVDLDTVAAELQRVVGDTMQPAHVSLWLREGGATR